MSEIIHSWIEYADKSLDLAANDSGDVEQRAYAAAEQAVLPLTTRLAAHQDVELGVVAHEINGLRFEYGSGDCFGVVSTHSKGNFESTRRSMRAAYMGLSYFGPTSGELQVADFEAFFGVGLETVTKIGELGMQDGTLQEKSAKHFADFYTRIVRKELLYQASKLHQHVNHTPLTRDEAIDHTMEALEIVGYSHMDRAVLALDRRFATKKPKVTVGRR